MKYFVAHLLKGDAAEYHRNLSQELSEHFHTAPIYDKVAPHLTVKIPFEANAYEASQVEAVLERFAAARRTAPLTVQGFGRFGFKTVYLDVVKSREAVEMVRDCIFELNTLPWMQQVVHEGNKLHASVARFMTYKKFRRVWRHVQKERPHFKTHFDSLALLRKDTTLRRWVLEREFALPPFGEHYKVAPPALVGV